MTYLVCNPCQVLNHCLFIVVSPGTPVGITVTTAIKSHRIITRIRQLFSSAFPGVTGLPATMQEDDRLFIRIAPAICSDLLKQGVQG